MSIARHPLIMFGTKPTGASFDADYQAVLTYATGQGYTLPTAPQQTLQNAFVLALKSAGIWNKLDILYNTATNGDSNFATINWKNPNAGFNLIKVNSPIYSSNQGFKGDSTSGYLNTSWKEATHGVNFTGTSASRFVSLWTGGATSGFDWITGCVTNLQIWTRILSNFNGNSIASGDFTPSPSTANMSTPMFLHLNKTGAGTMNKIVNGGTPTTHALTGDGLNNVDMWLLAATSGGIQQFSDVGFGVFGQGSNLTAESVDLYNAVNTYLTSL